jgi:SAM-dependent methyltransferase
MNNLESYIKFSKYYDLMIRNRNHYKAIADLLNDFVPPAAGKILDAACGQGNAFYFNTTANRVFYGNDGSKEMLGFLMQNHGLFLKYKAVFNYEWSDLGRLFEREKNFDLIFFLGNSLSHVENSEALENILRAVYNGISRTGNVLFDLRRWQFDSTKSALFENGRIENSNRKLLEAEEDGKRIVIYDRCFYETDRQIIEYSIEEDDNIIDKIKFSYLMIHPDSINKMLCDLKFNVKFSGKHKSYPYHVILGTK